MNSQATQTTSEGLAVAILAVLAIMVIFCLVGIVISIVLSVKYVKYNKTDNSAKLTGEEIARKILDKNGLENIKVKASGSITFGNSYSHFFKKVRLRRRTWKKTSLTSLGIAAQKSALAVMDKEKDPAMKCKVWLTPITYFGPIAFIPLLILGLFIDIKMGNTGTPFTIGAAILGLILFVLSFVMSFVVLRTEKKAQKRAYDILKAENMATAEELDQLKSLFKLYNIEYINDIILSILVIILLILSAMASGKSAN